MRTSLKMLESMCSEFKAYHYEIVDRLETDEDAKREQEYFDEHQRKTMEFIDRLGDLLSKPQPDDPTQAMMNGRLVDRKMDHIDGSVKTIKRVLDDPKVVDQHALSNYMDKVKSLESELQGLKREILSLDDYGGRIGRASDIEGAIFNMKVVISRLAETKKEHKKGMVGMPVISGTNLPRIVDSNF